MRVKRLLTFAKVDDARQTYPDLQLAFVTSHWNFCLASSTFWGVVQMSMRNKRKQKSLENTEESNLIHLALQLAIVTSQGNLCSLFHFWGLS